METASWGDCSRFGGLEDWEEERRNEETKKRGNEETKGGGEEEGWEGVTEGGGVTPVRDNGTGRRWVKDEASKRRNVEKPK
jgi:hypothetical protein